MVLEKTAYWVAVSVLALMVSNNVASHRGLNLGSLNLGSLPNRSFAAVEAVADDAIRLLGSAEVMLGQHGTPFEHSQATLACLQTRLASVQSRMAQHEAVLARVQAQRARLVAMQQFRGMTLCSR
jgi:hypothetical protein